MAASRQATDAHIQGTFKETIESIVIAFILAFTFRAYVVEAFVIPTGSMAPTLLGRHVRVRCLQCGYRFATDTPPGNDNAPQLQRDRVATCPMCHYPNMLPAGTRVSAGDRILVQKYIYCLTQPRRWDVLVFKAPHTPSVNYIKRLVGLPQERLWIIEGNIYVQPLDDHTDGLWHIARKPAHVQRAVWQPVYDSSYDPLDKGRASPGRAQFPWSQPWVAANPRSWRMDDRHGFHHDGSDSGEIRFDFRRAVLLPRPGLYGYNQFKHGALGTLAIDPIEDVRIAASFLPDGPGLGITLTITARLNHPEGLPMQLIGRVDAQGKGTLRILDPRTGQSTQPIEPIHIGPFAPGRARQVELWYADQEASLWVDGQRVLNWPFDLPIQTVKSRQGPTTTPSVAIAVEGTPVTLMRASVDRDLYYTSTNPSGERARGALTKNHGNAKGQPVELHADQFFCCGDNSPLSQDSRFWTGVDPWIANRMFPDAHDTDQMLGIVPGRLIMGKAFFVYFPTPLRVGSDKPAFVPNLADMRFIQ